MIAAFGAGLAPVSDVIFAEDPASETEKNQMPFQVPLRVRYDPYENEGIEVHFKVAKDQLENTELIENQPLNDVTERPLSGQKEATSGHISVAQHTQTLNTGTVIPLIEMCDASEETEHNILPPQENTPALKATGS